MDFDKPRGEVVYRVLDNEHAAGEAKPSEYSLTQAKASHPSM